MTLCQPSQEWRCFVWPVEFGCETRVISAIFDTMKPAECLKKDQIRTEDS